MDSRIAEFHPSPINASTFFPQTYPKTTDNVSRRKNSQAEVNQVLCINLPQVGCDLNKLDQRKVQALIQEVYRSTNIEIIVCVKPSKELPHESQDSIDSFDKVVTAETPSFSETLTSLVSAQITDPAL